LELPRYKQFINSLHVCAVPL